MGIVTCPQNVLINNKLSFFLEKKMLKRTFFKTFFQDCWLIDPAFNSWLEKVNNDLTIFQCKVSKFIIQHGEKSYYKSYGGTNT